MALVVEPAQAVPVYEYTYTSNEIVDSKGVWNVTFSFQATQPLFASATPLLRYSRAWYGGEFVEEIDRQIPDLRTAWMTGDVAGYVGGELWVFRTDAQGLPLAWAMNEASETCYEFSGCFVDSRRSFHDIPVGYPEVRQDYCGWRCEYEQPDLQSLDELTYPIGGGAVLDNPGQWRLRVVDDGTVPEPPVWALLAAGLFGLSRIRRRG